MKPDFVTHSPQPGFVEQRARTAPDADDCFAPPAEYFVVPTVHPPSTDSGDEGETRVIIEMRYQEYLARRALEALFESGGLELLEI